MFVSRNRNLNFKTRMNNVYISAHGEQIQSKKRNSLNKTLVSLLAVLLLSTSLAMANNVVVSTVSLTGQDRTAGGNNIANSAKVKFNLSWENSWRTNLGPQNWDAVWVYVKYRVSGGNWQHANLSNSGHSTHSGYSLTPALVTPGSAFNASTNPAAGVFIYRDSYGFGATSLSNVELKWMYVGDGLADDATVDIKVFAIEMVYVNQGAFNAGGGGGSSSFTPTDITTADATAAPSGTAGTIVAGAPTGGYPSGQTAPSSSSWPNGFSAFYCMKYEISQQQWVDFMNTLSYSEQATISSVGANAPNASAGSTFSTSSPLTTNNGVKIMTSGTASTVPAVYACDLDNDGNYNEGNDGGNMAMGHITYINLIAYLDWSALRPMTELEFEKACRGGITPVSGGFAWGTNTATALTSVNNFGTDSSTIGNTGANCNYNSGLSPLGTTRVGLFAYSASGVRVSAGATYYGIMEMSGNVWERVIVIGGTGGRAYTGLHGNGELSSGAADVANWPSTAVTGSVGRKGGSYSSAGSPCTVSDRSQTSETLSGRTATIGGRGVRTAP